MTKILIIKNIQIKLLFNSRFVCLFVCPKLLTFLMFALVQQIRRARKKKEGKKEREGEKKNLQRVPNRMWHKTKIA